MTDRLPSWLTSYLELLDHNSCSGVTTRQQHLIKLNASLFLSWNKLATNLVQFSSIQSISGFPITIKRAWARVTATLNRWKGHCSSVLIRYWRLNDKIASDKHVRSLSIPSGCLRIQGEILCPCQGNLCWCSLQLTRWSLYVLVPGILPRCQL